MIVFTVCYETSCCVRVAILVTVFVSAIVNIVVVDWYFLFLARYEDCGCQEGYD